MRSIINLLNKDLPIGPEDALAISVFTLINQYYEHFNFMSFLIIFLPIWIIFKIMFMKHLSGKE